jgi:hypothetical protein
VKRAKSPAKPANNQGATMSIVRTTLLAVALTCAAGAVAVPTAAACGGYTISEEDRVWSAAYAYLVDQQSHGGSAVIESVTLANQHLATARWAEPNSKVMTHAVLMKIDGRWQVFGTRTLAQSPAGSRLSSSPAVVANKR